MVEVSIDVSSGLVVVEPQGTLKEEDFRNLSRIVDDHLDTHDTLHGVMIKSEEFPGWDNVAAFVDHIRFVRDHHRRIAKVALVTDSPIGKLAETLSGHFVSAEVKCFKYDDLEAARTWLAND